MVQDMTEQVFKLMGKQKGQCAWSTGQSLIADAAPSG